MGLANCFWWIDREKGVAGFLAGQVSDENFEKIVWTDDDQVLPSGDPKVSPVWFMCEKTIYDNLE